MGRGVDMLGTYISNLNKLMDANQMQRDLIANNISNSNTPGYKVQKLQFEQTFNNQMALSLKGDDVNHISNTSEPLSVPDYNVYTDTSTKGRVDGNNVDTTTEMTNLIRNQYIYTNSVTALNQEFSLYKTAIGHS